MLITSRSVSSPVESEPYTSGALLESPRPSNTSGQIDFGKVARVSPNASPAQQSEGPAIEPQSSLRKAGDRLWFVPGLSNVLRSAGNAKNGNEDKKASLGGAVLGGCNGVMDTWKNSAKGIADDLREGQVPLTPARLWISCLKGNLKNSEATPDWAKKIAEGL